MFRGQSSWPRQDRNLWLYTPQRCLQLHAAEIADVGRAGSGTIDDLLRQMLRVAPSKFATAGDPSRIRAADALQHPALRYGSKDETMVLRKRRQYLRGVPSLTTGV